MAAMTSEIVQYLQPNTTPSLTPSPPEQRLLDEVNRRVAARATTEQVLRYLFEQTRDCCPGDRLSVAFVEDDAARRLVSYYTLADYEPLALDRGYAEDLRGSSLERVVTSGTIRLIHDLEQYLAAHPSSRSSRALLREGVRSSLTCPLLVESRVVGVLFRSARRPHAFSLHHAALHREVAERLAQVVDKTYRLEQLRAANEAYTEMLGFVSHELKSPVAAMVQTAQLFRDGYLGPLSERQRDAIGRIVSRGEYLLDLVRDYLELARLEGGAIDYAPRASVDLERDVLALAIDVASGEANRRGIQVELDVSPALGPVHVDPDLLRVIAVNLLSNAIKYGRDGGRVRVSARRDDATLTLLVWNEGPGFGPAERSRLFRKFSRLTAPELSRAKGSGVGLYTVWRLVSLHGGRVTARSEPGAWAEFGCTIPQPPAPPQTATFES